MEKSEAESPHPGDAGPGLGVLRWGRRALKEWAGSGRVCALRPTALCGALLPSPKAAGLAGEPGGHQASCVHHWGARAWGRTVPLSCYPSLTYYLFSPCPPPPRLLSFSVSLPLGT